jgi:peptidoglycan/LPS O-acetylase OafA/YrhL
MGLIRLFLAWVVVSDHWRIIELTAREVPTNDFKQLGFNAGYAVMFFYAISGFLITYTLTQNYSADTSGTIRFYKNRFIRIFSLYWPIVIVAFLTVAGTWDRFLMAATFDKLTNLFLIGADWRVAFASYSDTHFEAIVGGIPQSWTLGAELSFYLMVPLLLRSWLLGAGLLFLSFGLRSIFVWKLGTSLHEIWTYHFAATTFGFFLLGHLACRAALRFPLLKAAGWGVVFLPASVVFMMFGGSYAGFDVLRFWGSILCFVVGLPSIFELTKDIRILNYLGNLSYPVYLIHIIVFVWVGDRAAQAVFGLFGTNSASFGLASTAAFIAVVTAIAVLAHHFIEKPTALLMQAIMSITYNAISALKAATGGDRTRIGLTRPAGGSANSAAQDAAPVPVTSAGRLPHGRWRET